MIRRLGIAGLTIGGALGCGSARAQIGASDVPGVPVSPQLLDNYLPSNLYGYDATPGVTVPSRIQPEYVPPGINAGGVNIHPQLNETFGYDDNVLGTSRKKGSAVASTAASIQAATDWTGNNLMLSLSADDVRYLDLPAQSFTNWIVGGGWSYDIGRDKLTVGLTHFNLNQIPTGIDSAGLTEPVPYRIDEARVSYKAVASRWTFVPVVDFSAIRFDDQNLPASPVQGTSLTSRNVTTASLSTFYEFAPQRSAVLVLRGTYAGYLSGAPRRDYTDGEVLVGLDYNTEAAFRYRFLVGYERRTFESSTFATHAAPIVEGTVIWTPTDLTTVTGSVLRRIEDSNEDTFVGYTFTQGRLTVDHELKRNVLLQGRAAVETADYLQSGTEQTIYTAGATATWLLGRNLSVSAIYDFVVNRQDVGTFNYERNIGLIQIHVAL